MKKRSNSQAYLPRYKVIFRLIILLIHSIIISGMDFVLDCFSIIMQDSEQEEIFIIQCINKYSPQLNQHQSSLLQGFKSTSSPQKYFHDLWSSQEYENYAYLFFSLDESQICSLLNSLIIMQQSNQKKRYRRQKARQYANYLQNSIEQCIEWCKRRSGHKLMTEKNYRILYKVIAQEQEQERKRNDPLTFQIPIPQRTFHKSCIQRTFDTIFYKCCDFLFCNLIDTAQLLAKDRVIRDTRQYLNDCLDRQVQYCNRWNLTYPFTVLPLLRPNFRRKSNFTQLRSIFDNPKWNLMGVLPQQDHRQIHENGRDRYLYLILS